jgi:tetratricopeptide (TPR) repeat protein
MAYNNRGVAQMEQNKLDDAKKDFEKALEINPKYAPAASNLSAIYFKQKDYKKSLELANKAVQNDPNYGNAYVNRANAKEMNRDLEGACDDWQKAKELGIELGKNYYSSNCNE